MMRQVLWVVLIVVGCGAPPPKRPVTPKVAPLDATLLCAPLPAGLRAMKVDPVNGNDSASGECASASACTPWKTLTHAAATAKPGDLIRLAGGRYSEDAAFSASGTSEKPIVFAAADGEVPVFEKSVLLNGNAYVQFRGLQFEAPNNDVWLQTDAAAHDIALVGNAFDSNSDKRGQAFSGLQLSGRHLVLCGNVFGSWLGDMVTGEGVDELLIQNNDFSQSSGMHALVSIVGKHVIIRGNAFRNPWHRVLHITDRSSANQSEDIVVENNTFIESDWAKGRPVPSNEEQFQGGAEVVRFLGARGVFRNNLVAGNHEGNNWACRGVLNFQTYTNPGGLGADVRRYTKFRVYNNTFASNKTSSIVFYEGPKADTGNLDDNKFKNNIIVGAEKYSIATCNKGIPWWTYRFENNWVTGAQVRFSEVGELPGTIKDMQVSFSESFSGNSGDEPQFVNNGFAGAVGADPTSYRLANLPEAFAAYRLASGSPGVAKAGALANVIGDVVASTTLRIDDAYWFSSGYGLVAGDAIRVGLLPATITRIDLAANTLTLDRPVSAKKGDPVTLDGFTDVGVK